MGPENADRTANSEDPDQIAPLIWVTLFAYTYLQKQNFHYFD